MSTSCCMAISRWEHCDEHVDKASLIEEINPAISSTRAESDSETSSTRDATRRTSLSTCPDHRTTSVEETTASSAGNAETRSPDGCDSFGTARPGLRLTPSILGRSHGRLRHALHQQARLPTLNSRRNSTTATVPPSRTKIDQSVPHLEPVSLTLLHRVLRSRVNEIMNSGRG